MNKRLILILVINSLISTFAFANYLDNKLAMELIDELVNDYEFNRENLESVVGEANHVPEIIALMTRPAESISWHKYRDIFIQPERIEAGVEFIRTHEEQLKRAQIEFQVPPHIISAIIGVETFYGKFLGKHRVIDALATLGFDYPPRATFFREEFRQFLILACEERIEPFHKEDSCFRPEVGEASGKGRSIEELVGSYAGAMGYGQFIPSSYRNFAIDFNEDGMRDIWTNTTDAIGSIANYFAEHGWAEGERILEHVSIDPTNNQTNGLANQELKPSKTVQEWKKLGVMSTSPESKNAALFAYKNDANDSEQSSEYILGFDNFYVITRYNRSRLYARVVYQLATSIQAKL